MSGNSGDFAMTCSLNFRRIPSPRSDRLLFAPCEQCRGRPRAALRTCPSCFVQVPARSQTPSNLGVTIFTHQLVYAACVSQHRVDLHLHQYTFFQRPSADSNRERAIGAFAGGVTFGPKLAHPAPCEKILGGYPLRWQRSPPA